MKRIPVILLFLIFSLLINAQLPAFPGAEGWGMYTTGGRGGIVLTVTNLNDSGEGSFREAVMNPNPRIVIFKISGTIGLKSELIIKDPFLTIAGQTAPGDGICLKNFPLRIQNTHNIIIRSIRVRPGIESGLIGSEIDAIEIRESENIIVDHSSFSWSNDEGINNWHKSGHITFQWCIMSEPLNRSVHEKGAHGFASTLGGYKSSFHHNILANAVARNPSIGGNDSHHTVLLDIRNCVISNWGHRSCDGKPLSVNIINNYYKPGPATKDDVKRRIARIDRTDHMGFGSLWHIEGNYVEGYPDISANNWDGGIDFEANTSIEKNRQAEAFKVAGVTTQSATEAYKSVLANVGCTNRDSQEERIIKQIETGKYLYTKDGIVDNIEQVGGYPILKTGTILKDSDGDGMPDEWEIAQGLNPHNAKDASLVFQNGYTNIENYINSLIPDPYKK